MKYVVATICAEFVEGTNPSFNGVDLEGFYASRVTSFSEIDEVVMELKSKISNEICSIFGKETEICNFSVETITHFDNIDEISTEGFTFY